MTPTMSSSPPDRPGDADRGWPRGRIGWVLGTILLFGVGAIFGQIFGSLLLGLMLAAVVSIGWVMAYESWRGKTPHLHDEDDDGARL